ncbi:NAD(P)-dependent alcohol dehydrogenase [Kitasatospora sp. NBC_01287]|uniref:zinc-dependent alcohol dehydrogenase family protein n=1 Tax=Kitasatospora sp. NBC_01287 TaxID=2903573 RepID=UPI002258E163|nr:NAD(P)-dependent alcohol dehydrogenase [Kitasatospora sp. NBC_01287]MCX4747864.1 NAD(P)-dependent alcohol dehydrogenase [Kitasatospora sp. NBC_01287]
MTYTQGGTAAGYHFDRHEDGLDGLVRRGRAIPEPGANQVLIRVRAASLNRRDLMILDGTYAVPAAPGVVPLSDGAGEVVAVGEGVSRAKAGDRVAVTYFRRWIDGPMTLPLVSEQHGANLGGMLTEYQVVDEESVVPIPAHLSFEEAATLPCAGVLAWSALTTGPRPMSAGDNVLVVGAGAVALFGVQLAAALGGRVIAVTSSDEKALRLKELGAAEVVDRRVTPAWESAVLDLTGRRGVELVLEAVGAPTIANSIRSIGFNGQISVAGAFPSGGTTVDTDVFNGRFFSLQRLAAGSRASFEALNGTLAEHRIHPVIDRVFGFDEALDAYRHLRDGAPFGKVVITIP